MNDFENKDFGGENSGSSSPRPDYYQPTGNSTNQNSQQNGTYYTPPQENNNTTYHYAYGSTQSNPQNNQNGNNQTYYTDPSQQSGGDKKPPKKSKAAKIIVIVLAVCLIAAGVGIGISLLGGDTATSDNNSNNTTQSQDNSDAGASISSSEEVPLKDGDDYTVAGVADVAMDSCVGIAVYSQQTDAYNYFYNYGNGNTSDEPIVAGEGSGVIMSEQNGKTYILTCAHVISDGDSFTVTLNDGTELEASMVGFDSQTDIGVLSVNKTGLKIAEFADSKNLVVGEQVVAIGCPGGLEFMNSVTSGYISALDRPVSSSIGYDTECIQTDAAINPGNSGGALFNMQGQVIGINSSKIASTEYEGMGFAVPSTTAVETANSLIKVGYVEGRAKLGIQYNPITSFSNYENVLNALAQAGFKDAEGTMVIRAVNDDSDLASKDIKEYDMIVAVEGKTMTSTDVMTSILADSKPGDKITLTIARIEGQEIKTFDVECTLVEAKGND